MTPVELKCYQCIYFVEVKQVPENEGLFKYLCLAYPEGIPEDIRCWDAENPSATPRAHTSVQKDQKGDFVFEQRPPVRDLDITVDNILDYQIYDVSGLVGPFATTYELELFRGFIFDLDDNDSIKEFLRDGASLLTQEFLNDVFDLESTNEDIQEIIIRFQELINGALVSVSIGDGE